MMLDFVNTVNGVNRICYGKSWYHIEASKIGIILKVKGCLRIMSWIFHEVIYEKGSFQIFDEFTAFNLYWYF